jgi:hypothetical protein
MKSRNAILSFLGGLFLGIVLAVGFGASGQSQAPAVPAKDWSHVTMLTYPSGLTGFFDQTTGRIYMYDTSSDNCVMIRELTALGSPTRRIR